MDDVEKLVEAAAEKSEHYRSLGYHCSESSIRAVCDTLGITVSDDILRISSGFRGGGGGYMERCGILEAGIMLISYRYGRTDPGADIFGYSYLIRLLHERFLRELGSYTCRVLLPFSIRNTPDNSCSLTYVKGTKVLTRLLLEADQLLKNVPDDQKGKVMVAPPI
ncbi:MAG: C-GCAxxG-C-C family protein [Treponemataceae bacterium]